MNREELKKLRKKFKDGNIVNTFNEMILILLPGIIHELNNSHAVIDGYLQFLTGKIPISEDKKDSFSQKITTSSSEITLIVKALTMLISQKDIVFPTSTSEIVSALKYALKIQIYKNLKIESEFLVETDEIFQIKIGNVIGAILLIILSFLAETKEGGKFIFSIKKEEKNIILSLIFEKMNEYEIEEFNEIFNFTKKVCEESKGTFNFKEDKNSRLNFNFIFNQSETDKG